MLNRRPNPKPPLFGLIMAFAIIYVVWGSTYLAVRIAVETIPPFVIVGVRSAVAGAALYGLARLGGASPPKAQHWRSAVIVGGILFFGGTSTIVWASQRIHSGLVALLLAMVPAWTALFDWFRPGGKRPNPLTFVGLLLGLIGIAVLVGPVEPANDWVAIGALLLSSMLWAGGSLCAMHVPLPDSVLLATGMQMLAGGAIQVLLSLLAGQWAHFDPSEVSLSSLLALGYLTIFGSLVTFSAYFWLLRVSTPTRAATYAYVNPVVAILLGWLLANEPLTPRILIAAAMIIGAVALVNISRDKEAERPQSGPSLDQQAAHDRQGGTDTLPVMADPAPQSRR